MNQLKQVNQDHKNRNRVLLSILFGIGGILFLVLFLDSHYKNINGR